VGGKAFKDITSPIRQSEIAPTMQWLEDRWPDYIKNGGNLVDHLLGSAGKNPTSGDIDLNMDIDHYDQEVVAQQLTAILGADKVQARPGNNQIFTAVPVPYSDRFVQVDFMFGNYAWQKFSYFSPALWVQQTGRYSYLSYSAQQTHSRIKGLYRTELIKAMVAYNSDWVLEENGEMIARVGPTFFHDRGLVWRYRHRPMRKDGTARVKALEELTEQEFMAIYPSAVKARTSETQDVEKVVKMLFGHNASSSICNTFELIIGNMRAHYSSDAVAVIHKIYLERLNSLKVEIPAETFRSYGIKV
jgi:hypothetical protein